MAKRVRLPGKVEQVTLMGILICISIEWVKKVKSVSLSN